jgi:hypothetical protein
MNLPRKSLYAPADKGIRPQGESANATDCRRTALNIVDDQSGSAFMIDVSQVSLALRRATSRSLLIIDEFGKGVHIQLCLKAYP